MAKYKFIKADIGQETPTDSNGLYSVVITVGLKHLEGIRSGEEFSRDIIVASSNDQTGSKVDEDRKKAIKDYCELNEIQYD